MNLQSHKALVTGGAVRIGRAICRALAVHGCDVAIHCRESLKEATALAQELRELGRRVWVIRGSLSSEQGCRRVFEKAWAETGGFDILINNAAVFNRNPLLQTDAKTLWNELQTNLIGPVMLIRFLAQRIIGATGGGSGSPACRQSQACAHLPLRASVVNLLDRRITANETGCFAYLLSKKMLAAATLNAALELAPFLRINAVAPGAILPPRQKKPKHTKEPAGHIPLGIQCTPEHVAEAVIFLLEADTITGQIIYVDGGQHLLWNVDPSSRY